MADGETHPLVLAAIRVCAGVFAALVVAVGFFGESLTYALALGVVVGVGFALVGLARGRLGEA